MLKKAFKPRIGMLCLACLAVCLITVPAEAAFPERPIRLIVHTDAGGGADTNIRRIQPYLEKELGVPLALENRPGAASMLGPKMLSESEGDGYTIGMAGSPNTELGLLTMDGMFAPDSICMLGSLTQDAAVIMVRKDSPWNTFEELVKDAKSRPGKITASIGTATSDNFIGLRLIEKEAGIDLNIVSFGGGSPARLALIGGHVDLTHSSLFAALSILDSVKILAVHWEKNNWPELTDNAPTVVSMYPNIGKVNCGTMDLLVAPASLKTNYPERYLFIAKAFENAANNPEFRASLEETGQLGLWNNKNHDELTEYYFENLKSFESYLDYFKEDVEQRKAP